MKKLLLVSIATLIAAALLIQPSAAQHHDNHHQNHQHSAHDHDHDHTEAFDDVSEEFQSELTAAIEAYIAGKDAFFESDLNSAKSEIESFKEKVEAIGKHAVSGDGHMAWMESYDKLIEHSGNLTAASDIDEARSTFRHLSDELITAVHQFGIESVVYHQYCPMALDSDGATWLSRNEKIQNPYSPETMPGCGEVIERISRES